MAIHKMHLVLWLYTVRMDVGLRRLRCLVAIVDAGGFTNAAAELVSCAGNLRDIF